MDFKLRANARNASDRELLEDLRRTAKVLGKDEVGQREYVKIGRFSVKPYWNRFGSWNKALKSAGLGIVRPSKVSNNELFENLEQVWRKLGRQPFYGEIRKPFSKYAVTVYCRRFGGWFKACEVFIRSKKQDPKFVKLLGLKSTSRSRVISERLRLQIFKRDHYACCTCGRSPAIHRGVILHVDHVVPFSKGGDNSPKNLRVLCAKCNLGKGDIAGL